MNKKMVRTQEYYTLIENDHLSRWSPSQVFNHPDNHFKSRNVNEIGNLK